MNEQFFDELFENPNLQVLFPKKNNKIREEIIYRKNGKSIDKVNEFDIKTGSKIRTTHYDYFNDKKIRSIDEYDEKTGRKVRTINFVLYKSIDEYDLESGKKIRTINFNVKDENKISSVQEYDLETGKIITVSIFKRDGKTLSITKKIDPDTDKVTNFINDDKQKFVSDSFKTRSYDNVEPDENKNGDSISFLLDNLYSKETKFENIAV